MKHRSNFLIRSNKLKELRSQLRSLEESNSFVKFSTNENDAVSELLKQFKSTFFRELDEASIETGLVIPSGNNNYNFGSTRLANEFYRCNEENESISRRIKQHYKEYIRTYYKKSEKLISKLKCRIKSLEFDFIKSENYTLSFRILGNIYHYSSHSDIEANEIRNITYKFNFLIFYYPLYANKKQAI